MQPEAQVEITEPVELAIVEPTPATLYGTSDPLAALTRMAEISDRIVDVIEAQRFYATIGSKKYVTCPGWKTAGGMLGLSPYTVWTKPNETQDGYIARVEVRTLDERTIAAAEAECSRDEPNWKTRPRHALRSMAETRATSRALRGPLEQVFALGGYEGTTAEDMPVDQTQPRETEKASAEGPIPDRAKPTAVQLDELRALLRILKRIEPETDWTQRCKDLVGVPARLLTGGGAVVLIDKLQTELARLNVEDGADA
jgi:hypothetical protein